MSLCRIISHRLQPSVGKVSCVKQYLVAEIIGRLPCTRTLQTFCFQCRNFVTDLNTFMPKSSEIDIAELADTVMKRAIAKDVMNKCLPVSKVCEDLKALHEAGVQPDDILKICDKITTLKNLNYLQALVDELKKFGLKISDIVNVFISCQNIQDMTVENMTTSLNVLQQAGFSTSALIDIVRRKPTILETDVDKINLRMSELKQLFKTSDSFSLISRHPDLIFCDISYIHDRFNYVFHEMGITQRQMLYSKLFMYPMEHIHARHMFVVRAGFFKKVKNKHAQIDNNPTLDKILDPSDEEFARKFGGMTLMDYQVFKQLLLREHVILKELDNELLSS